MDRKALQIGWAVFLMGAILFLALTLLEHQTQAQEESTIYVAPDGDCGGVSPCYAHPQEAVGAANEGDLIKIAAGTYTGVRARRATIPTPRPLAVSDRCSTSPRQ